ncbi:MAG TPA: glycerophosphodiester phosphodiesterase, partial [Cupriavidus sp.]|nr:glycerophosphodiester phosphodiesterase [Cupriavidus sp.]
WLERLRRLECVALDANHRELDAAVIGAAHSAGFKVLCYTVNDPARAANLLSWGLDGLITDAVDQIAPQS